MSSSHEPVTLEVVVAKSGVEAEGALALKSAFSPFFTQAEEWRAKVATVTDPKVARSSRLVLKAIRCEADAKRVSLKKSANTYCAAVEAAFDTIESRIKPMEAQLLAIEKAAEIAEEARKQAVRAERQTLLAPYGINTQFFDLAGMSVDDFARLLSDTKSAYEARIEAARKAEAERVERERQAEAARIAKERADAEERERQRIENERLKREAAVREAALAEERRVAAVAAAEAKRKADEAEEAARKERARIEAENAAKLAEQRRAADEAAAKAKAEANRLAEIARVEREAREKLEREAKAIADREAARKAAEVAEAERAAHAPDREKLASFAALLRTVELPEMATRKGKTAAAQIVSQISVLIRLVETHAENL